MSEKREIRDCSMSEDRHALRGRLWIERRDERYHTLMKFTTNSH